MSNTVHPLRDGHSTTISLTGAGVTFWEKTVQPPGLEGGEPIDTTNMRNTVWRTSAPRRLKTATPCEATVSYDPTTYTSIREAINVNQQITVTFPDGGTIAFYGFLKTFTPEALQEGQEPSARITIIPTNTDTDGAESAPVITGGSGTA